MTAVQTLVGICLLAVLLFTATSVVQPKSKRGKIKREIAFQGPTFSLSNHGLPMGFDLFGEDSINLIDKSVLSPISTFNADRKILEVSIQYTFPL